MIKYLLVFLYTLLIHTLSAHAYMTIDEVFEKRFETSSKVLSLADQKRMENLVNTNTFFGERIYKRKKTKFVGTAVVDLRNRDTVIKTQDNGKCTAYAGTALIENLLNKDQIIEDLDVSDWDVWDKYKQYSCDAFINALSKKYVCDEKDYPQHGKKKSTCIGKYGKITANDITEAPEKILEALDKGNVVYTGVSVPLEMIRCHPVISKNSDIIDGGHALAVVGYYKQDGEVYLVLKNSWGADCGDKGYQYFPIKMCERKDMYCLFWEISSVEEKK